MPATLPQTPRALKGVLFGILLLAAALRLWNIDAGIPYAVGEDEPAVMEKSLLMVRSGDPNPRFFDYGGVTFTIQAAVVAARFFEGALAHKFTKLEYVWEGDFYLWGRILTALIGTLTVYIVYQAARRWGTTTALVAAFAMAIQPQAVLESHRAQSDTPLMLFVAITLLLSLKAIEDGRTRAYLFAGLAAGLATATKYNGAIAIVMPLSAALLAASARPRWKLLLAVVGGGAMGFFGGAPYTVLDLPHFLDNFAELVSHYNGRTSAWTNASTYLKHIRNWFGTGGATAEWMIFLTWPARLLTMLGLVIIGLQLRSSAKRAAALVIVAFPFLYLWFIANQSLVFGRYGLPFTPAISLCLAIGLVATRDTIVGTPSTGRHRRRVLLILLLVLFMPLAQAAQNDAAMSKDSTKEQAATWIVRNVKSNQPIVSDGDQAKALRFPPVRLLPNGSTTGFQLEYVPRLNIRSIEQYRREGKVYLMSLETDPDKYLRDPALEELRNNTDLMMTFRPSSAHPGPPIMIFKIR